MRSGHTFETVDRPQRLPAWVLSAAMHLIILLTIGWLVDVRPPATTPTARPVSIVLSAPDRLAEPAAESVASGGNPADPIDLAEALPRLAASPEGRSIELPRAASSQAGALDTAFLDAPRGPTGGQGLPARIDPSAVLAEAAKMRAERAALGPATAVRLFGAAAEGRKFVFLIDRSKSMGAQGLRALAAAEAELLRGLKHLQPNHRFQVIAYHHQCIYLNDNKLLPATAENLRAIRGHLSGLAAFGATEHENALRTALTWEPDALFLLTDGGDPALTDTQLRIIARRAGGKTAIHSIQFGFGPQREESNFLTRLANENGGSYRYVNMSQQ